MKITILYDNTIFQSGLESDWGFSCLVETQNRTILFDTGSNGSILMNNMNKLNINPSVIDDVFISHPHFDHIGGLSAFLNENNNVTVYIPFSVRGIRNVKKVVSVRKPVEFYPDIFSTGTLARIEQAMVVKTDKGMVVVVGCSHPKMKKILQAASKFGKIHAIIGGLHGFNDYELFKDLGVICPVHCTQHIPEIKSRFPEKYIGGGVGKILSDKELGI